MRHNPAAGAIIIMLRSLKMHGMAQAVGELTEQGSPAFEAALPILSQLLKAETADREVRSTAYQLKAARFPNYRDLTGFDFASSEVNEALVRQLHRCEFIEDAQNAVLVGGPGTGKTHLATAIGVQAIEQHRKRVRFFSTVELVNALEQEKLQGKPGQIAGAAYPCRSRHSRRAGLPAVQRLRRRLALPSLEQALRANQHHHHDQSQLRRMGHRVRRPEDDDRVARSAHSPLPHSRNRKRQLPLQEQLGEDHQTQQGEITKLDERLTLKPSSSRVSPQWKSRVKSQRKSTREKPPTSPSCDAHDFDAAADDVGGALLAFRTSGHRDRSLWETEAEKQRNGALAARRWMDDGPEPHIGSLEFPISAPSGYLTSTLS